MMPGPCTWQAAEGKLFYTIFGLPVSSWRKQWCFQPSPQHPSEAGAEGALGVPGLRVSGSRLCLRLPQQPGEKEVENKDDAPKKQLMALHSWAWGTYPPDVRGILRNGTTVTKRLISGTAAELWGTSQLSVAQT